MRKYPRLKDGEIQNEDVICKPLVTDYNCTIICEDYNFTMKGSTGSQDKAVIPLVPEAENCTTICYGEPVGTGCFNKTTGKPIPPI